MWGYKMGMDNRGGELSSNQSVEMEMEMENGN
jgi:hypothetical protein